MKKIIFTLFIIHCSLIITNAQSGWYGFNSGTGRQLNSLYFINSNTGWVVGDSIILKTTNGGINWAIQTLPTQTRNSSVHFINENTGFIVGDKNYDSYNYGVYTFKTTNGGINWITVNNYFPAIIGTAYFNNVYAVNENIVYRTYGQYLSYSNSGGVHKSTDGGISFSTSLGAGDIKGLSFINSQTGWAVSYSSGEFPPSLLLTYNTTNAGSNWTLRDSIRGFNSRAIQFINESTGYVLVYSNNTMMFKTTNGGINWTRDTINNSKCRGMYFINSLTGWIAGYPLTGGSNISHTTNGGLNWSDQFPQGTTTLNAIYFTDAMTGWAVGYYGVILKTTNGGVTSILNNNKEVPFTYSLSQNYPNPFNPITKIKFDIKKEFRSQESEVKLSIYDILGRKIEDLVNEKLQPGSYEVTFDGSDLPSGIYFCKLQAGGFTETKKIVLLK
ncbi:MAG TPA: T9SS type A sorting domain-containing protein [Ignavibacteria bacterium]